MHYLTFQGEQGSYPVALLTKVLRSREITDSYVAHLGLQGIPAQDLIAVKLDDTLKTADHRKEALKDILEELVHVQTRYIVCTDSAWFKTLTGTTTKVDAQVGYVLPCIFPGYEHLFVMYGAAPHVLFVRPMLMEKIEITCRQLAAHMRGEYQPPGINIIHFSAFPETPAEIGVWIDRLLEEEKPLAIDIETFDLKHYNAGIGTICFAWSEHEGIAFRVDLNRDKKEAAEVRKHLKRFFMKRKQQVMYHRIWFDAYVLIYQLFMEHILDTQGLLRGLKVMLRDWDDTQLITYLATNSCAGNKLSLKETAQEFSGNYAKDVTDITAVPVQDLLTYNLIDGLSTWYTFNKHRQMLIQDQQEEIYQGLFKDAIVDIIQMQLTGLPINLKKVKQVKTVLSEMMNDAEQVVLNSKHMRRLMAQRAINWAANRNLTLKKKRVSPGEYKEPFNIRSGPQVQELLYVQMALPVLDLTDSKQPSTEGDTLKKLLNHAENQTDKDLIQALLDYKAVEKIVGSFIPAFEQAALGPDGWNYLFGFFNLGGTVSGRLSSSDPNLQNLPANVDMSVTTALMEKYGYLLEPFVKKGKLALGKLVKYCFEAPTGWLFCGLDYNSLEDRISALTTKDPNKLKVYTDGYDGHSFRALYYFREQMPDIIEADPDSVNSIQEKYKELRQDSKGPTFALTYQGTWVTLVNNLGWTKEKAQAVEKAYHTMYKVSDDWVQAKLQEASKTGYVTVAFGLRVRTPLLSQVILGNRRTPSEAAAEGRTAGNALGQSYGLLNTRSSSAFMKKVRESKYALDIRPCAHIHDAQYYLIRNNVEAVHWANENLVPEVQWQELPEIAHDEVKLGGALAVFYPDWSKEFDIPNGASRDEILTLATKHKDKLT